MLTKLRYNKEDDEYARVQHLVVCLWLIRSNMDK